MSVILIKDKVTAADLEKAREEYQNYVKITVDLTTNLAVIGGEYHADAEEILIRNDSRQDDICGGGFNLETSEFETNAMINLRPKTNYSTEILDPTRRAKFLKIAEKIFADFIDEKNR